MDWLERVTRVRRWTRGGDRDPHKPLLLLYAFGRLQRHGAAVLRFRDVEEDLTRLLAEFGPPRPMSPGYPFHQLAADGLWCVTTADGRGSPGPDADALRVRDAIGQLMPEFAADLLAFPAMLTQVASIMLDANFEPSLHADICAATGLTLAELGSVGPYVKEALPRFPKDPVLRQRVLVAYECRCAFCGYEGWLGDSVVGLESARLRWWAFDGADDLSNSICLCSLHHRLLDKGVLGLTPRGVILVSRHFTGTTDASRDLVLSLAGRRAQQPQRGFPRIDARNVDWHARQVFRGPART